MQCTFANPATLGLNQRLLGGWPHFRGGFVLYNGHPLIPLDTSTFEGPEQAATPPGLAIAPPRLTNVLNASPEGSELPLLVSEVSWPLKGSAQPHIGTEILHQLEQSRRQILGEDYE